MSLDSKIIKFSNSQVRKGKLEEAMKTLQKLRGSSYRGVEEEVTFSHPIFLVRRHFVPRTNCPTALCTSPETYCPN